MVRYLISFSFRNRWVVLLISMGFFGWGAWSVKKNPIDAIPDVSENQVIVFTEWMGRSPQVIEDQDTKDQDCEGYIHVRNEFRLHNF
jgi:Cu/Ag efflux pump CusA